jgi:hypothetical protein
LLLPDLSLKKNYFLDVSLTSTGDKLLKIFFVEATFFIFSFSGDAFRYLGANFILLFLRIYSYSWI